MKALVCLLILCGSVSARSVKSQQIAQCIENLSDDLLPVFEECSQFYLCKNGKAMLKDCNEGLFFDSQTKNCTEAALSDCVQDQPPPLNSSEDPTNTTAFPTYICLGKAIGSVVPSRTNCSEYFSCKSSTPDLKACDKDFHFHPDSQSCISANMSECVIKVKPPVTTTRKPDLIETVCKGMFDGERYPVPGSCSKYFDCLGHKAYEKSCDANKHFYPVSRTCIDAQVSECFDGDVRLNFTIPSENEVNESNNDLDTEFLEEEHFLGNNTHVNVSDSSYLSIANNRSSGESSRSFDGDEPQFENEAQPSPKTFRDEESCRDIFSETLLPSANNCEQFVTCKDGNGFLTNCPPGLHFNAETKACDWPDQAGCSQHEFI